MDPPDATNGSIRLGGSNGLHSIYRERSGGCWEGDLGEIYRFRWATQVETVGR